MKFYFNIFVILLFFKPSVQNISWDGELCEKQLEYVVTALRNPREKWAIEMFDYWAKIQSGISAGNLQTFGHFEECLRFRHFSSTVGLIRGQHCMVRFQSTEHKTNSSLLNPQFDWREVGNILRENELILRSGVCVPITCSIVDVLDFMDTFLINADLRTIDATCQADDSFSLNALDKFAIVIFSFIGLLLLISTIYEIYMVKHDQEPNKLYASFSISSNGSELFDMTKSKAKNAINCLHGIRALSVLWVVLGHRRFFHLFFPLTNANEINNWLENVRTVLFQTDHLAVDTFFVIGALLLTLSFFNDLEKKRVSLWKMYLKRYLRYTPVLAVLILFHLTLFKYTISGPTFNHWEHLRNCRANWWAALLHIQNYLDWTQMCLGHSWYLSADFQLFLISPFLLYPVWKFGWKFLWTFPLIVVLVMIYLFIMAFIHEVPVFYLKLTPETSEIFHRFIYFPTHGRMGPWFIGMILGFFIFKSLNRGKKIKLGFVANTSLWVLGLSIIFAVVFGFYPFMQMNYNTTTVFSNAFYLATFRTAFAVGVALMIWLIACHSNSGGFIKWFLSLPQWQPLSRMGLSIYLVHTIWQTIILQNQKQAMHFSEISMVHDYFGDVLAVLMLGAVLFVAIENPIMRLVKHFLGR